MGGRGQYMNGKYREIRRQRIKTNNRNNKNANYYMSKKDAQRNFTLSEMAIIDEVINELKKHDLAVTTGFGGRVRIKFYNDPKNKRSYKVGQDKIGRVLYLNRSNMHNRKEFNRYLRGGKDWYAKNGKAYEKAVKQNNTQFYDMDKEYLSKMIEALVSPKFVKSKKKK